jgi:hypothetical protein
MPDVLPVRMTGAPAIDASVRSAASAMPRASEADRDAADL